MAEEEMKLDKQSHATLLLKKIAGFFAIEISLTHALPDLFSSETLRETWNLTHTALQKMLEVAMGATELDEMIELKHSMLIFCLCAQDQGLSTPQDKMEQILVRLQEKFIYKVE